MIKYVMAGFMIVSLFAGCESGGSYSPPVDTNSFDYKYSKTRFKMEGYSDKDSDTAARAIMKFNEAQRNKYR
jgi:hypothetical protein